MTDTPPRNGHSEQNSGNAAQHHRDLVKWTRAVACFTFLLFVANAFANFFIYEQWDVANKAQIDTRDQLRAVVGFVQPNQVILADKDSKVTGILFFPQFQNFGGTRTAIFHAWASVHYFGAVPNNLDLSQPYDKVDQPNIVIGQNSTTQIGPVAIFGEDVQRAINDKTGISLLWGRAEYSDIFQPKIIHHIAFCLALRPVTGAENKPLMQITPYKSDCNYSD